MGTELAVLVELGKSLFDLRDAFKNAKRERKDRIATLLDSIGHCLDEVAKSLRQNQYPSMRCAEMRTYAIELPNTIDDAIGPQKAAMYGQQLMSAHAVEQLYVALQNDPERDQKLMQLEDTAGTFCALAGLTRAS
jgi:hypothetical protein